MPFISVIIPTFNSANLLKEAINSVLAQTYSDYEIIVVDDGSTDHTSDIVAYYSNKITYIYQNNSHISVARNNGFRHSNGKYIAHLDADDIWLPQKLEKQVNILISYPEAAMVTCDGYLWITEQNNKPQQLLSEILPKQKSGHIFSYIYKTNPIPTSSAVIAHWAWEKLGGLNENMRRGQDSEFFNRISALGSIYYCPEPLMKYRRHGSNTCSHINPQSVLNRMQLQISIRGSSSLVTTCKTNGPTILKIYHALPTWCKYILILYWRLKYTKSTKYVLHIFHTYASNVIKKFFNFKAK